MKDLTDLEEIADKQKEIANAFNEVFNTTVDTKWVEENKELLDEWYNATGEEAQKIALKLQELAIAASYTAEEIANIDLKVFDESTEKVLTGYDALKSIIENNPITITANGRADMTDLINSLLEAGADAEWVANYLKSIGETDVILEGFGDELQSFDLDNAEGIAAFVESLNNWNGEIKATGGYVPSQGVADMSNVGGGKGGGGSGGSGGDRKEKELKKASDEIERYHKIDKTIDSLSKQYDRLSAAKDKAFGTARLKLIEKENALLQQQTENEKARLEEVKKYYAQDRSAIEAYGAIIDSNGVISNYDEIM